MGAFFSTPKLPSLPKRRSKAANTSKPAANTSKPAANAKKSKKSKKSKSGYEEPEEYANWAMALSPAAYEAVTGKIRKEKYESEEEYASEGEEEYESRHQVYTPADFSSVATPLNFSVVLMILLLVLIILARR